PVNFSRFLRRIPTTSDAVHPHKASSTNSIGVLAVFSAAVSITIECPEVAAPTNRSLSVQLTEASIIVPPVLALPGYSLATAGYPSSARDESARGIVPARRV